MVLCHDNATCISTGPGTYICSCSPGYHGDGYACDPVDPCQVDNGGCDTNRSVCQYTGPGKVCHGTTKIIICLFITHLLLFNAFVHPFYDRICFVLHVPEIV